MSSLSPPFASTNFRQGLLLTLHSNNGFYVMGDQHSFSILMTLHIFVWQHTWGYIYGANLGTPTLAGVTPPLWISVSPIGIFIHPFWLPEHRLSILVQLLRLLVQPPRNITIRQLPIELRVLRDMQYNKTTSTEPRYQM